MRLPDRFTVDGVTWGLRRAWPRDPEVCPLELEDREGRTIVGQWFADPDTATRERRRTPGSRSGDDLRLVLQPGGADRQLPGLAPAIRSGAELVAHRPGRRAVVRTPTGRYVKYTRPGRAGHLANQHRSLGSLAVGLASVPEVTGVGEDHVELAALPGCSVLELAEGDVTRWRAIWHDVGRLLDRLGASPPEGLPLHDAEAEAAVTRRWVERAVATGRLPERPIDRPLEPLTTGRRSRIGVAHRDLHDGQLVIDGGQLGILDPDTLAGAEPALDLANLLVHLQLRVEQGLLSPARAEVATAALSAATTCDPERVSAYERACRLRLAAVYSLRPRWRELALRWFQAATQGERAPT